MVSAHPAPVEPKVRRMPSQHSEDDGERKLGTRLVKALLRRSKALGTYPSEALLNEAEVVMVNEIPGVPAQGCSVSSGALATASESIDMAAETAAAVGNRPCQRRQAEPVPNVASKRLRTKTPPTISNAVTLCMRGLNIHWPFSQLILMGAKTEEVREYELGIAKTDEEVWIVETKGPHAKAGTNAIVGDLQIAPRPSAAQIVGTVRFASAHPYGSEQVFHNARDSHRIAVGSKFDWDGSGARYGWRVGQARALAKPVPVGSTGRTGFGARSFAVVFATTAAQHDPGHGSPEAKGVPTKSGTAILRGCPDGAVSVGPSSVSGGSSSCGKEGPPHQRDPFQRQANRP